MRARLPLLLLVFAASITPSASQDIPPERLFPLGTGDRWLYAVVVSRGSVDPPSANALLQFEDVEVVGDTVLGSQTWKLVYKDVLDADGTLLETTRYAQRHDPNGNNYITHELDCTNTCYIAYERLSDETWETIIGVGAIGYYVEGKGVNIDEGAALDGGSIDSYTSFASDIGLYHDVDDLRLPGGSYDLLVKRLIYAEVSGVVYGVNPLAVAPSPGADSPGFSLEIVPNPSRGIVVVKLSVPQPEPARVEVFDVHGRLVHASDVAAGMLDVEIDAGAWAIGLYVVRVSTASGARATRRVVRIE